MFDLPYYTTGGPGNTQYDVAPDGRFLMMRSEDSPRPYVVILEGLREKLKAALSGATK